MDDEDRELEQLVAAVQDQQSNLEPFVDLHTPDTVIVNIAGRRVLGTDDLRAAMQAALASPLANVTTTVDIHDVRRVRPDVALISCTKYVIDARRDGDDLPARAALTYLAVHDGQAWRIALAHTTPIATG